MNDKLELSEFEYLKGTWIDEESFGLQLDSVLTDSRCPVGSVCTWEGNAETKLDLILNGNYQFILNLNTNNRFPTDTMIDNIRFKLVGLDPYPEINKAIEQKDYKVKILTEKQ